jgi:hypothetical protein
LSNSFSARSPLQRFTPDPGRGRPIAGHRSSSGFVCFRTRACSRSDISRMEEATYWLGRRIHPGSSVASRAPLSLSFEGSQPTPRRLLCAMACDRCGIFVRHRPAHAAVCDHPGIVGPLDARPRITFSVTRTGRDRRLSWGLSSLQRLPAVLRCPGLATLRTMPLRRCGGARAIGVRPNPRCCHPFVLAVFRLTSAGIAIALVCSPPRSFTIARASPAANDIRRRFACWARRSSLRDAGFHRLAGLNLDIRQPATLLGFGPFAALFRMRQFRMRLPPRRPTCRLIRHILLD